MVLISLLVLAVTCNLLPLRCSAVTAAQDRAGGGTKRYHGHSGYGHKHNFKTELALNPSQLILRCKVKEPLEHIIWVVSRCPGHQGGYGAHPDRLVAEGATVNDPANYDVRVVGANSTITSDLLIKSPLSAKGAGVYRCEAWPHGGGGPPYGYVAQEVYIVGGKEMLKSCFGGWESPLDIGQSGGGGGFHVGYGKSKHRGGDSHTPQYPRYNFSAAASSPEHQVAPAPQQQDREPDSTRREGYDTMSRLPVYPSRPGRYPQYASGRIRVEQSEQQYAQESREQGYSMQQGDSSRVQPHSVSQGSDREQPHDQINQQYNHQRPQRFREQTHRSNFQQQKDIIDSENIKREQPENIQQSSEAASQHSQQFHKTAHQNSPNEQQKPLLVFATSQPNSSLRQAQPIPPPVTATVAPASQTDELQMLMRRYQEYLKVQRQAQQQATTTSAPTIVPPRSYVALHTQEPVKYRAVTETPIRPSPSDPGAPPAWSQLVARVQSRSSRAMYGAAHGEEGRVEKLHVDTALTQVITERPTTTAGLSGNAAVS